MSDKLFFSRVRDKRARVKQAKTTPSCSFHASQVCVVYQCIPSAVEGCLANAYILHKSIREPHDILKYNVHEYGHVLVKYVEPSLIGSNETGVFSGSAASFCLVVFILDILAKGAGVYTFLRLYKELEAGSIRPNATFASGAAGKREGGTGAGGGSAYNMAPLDSREHRGQIGSPTGR